MKRSSFYEALLVEAKLMHDPMDISKSDNTNKQEGNSSILEIETYQPDEKRQKIVETDDDT